MPAGDRVGSVVVIWPASRNGWPGTAPAAPAERLGDLLDRVADVHGARGGRRGRRPRHRAVERPVDLDGAGVELEGSIARAVPGPGRRRPRAAAVEQRRRHVGDHGPAGGDRLPSAVRTPVARPRSTSMPTTSASQRISPPEASSRRASAGLSMPAPPSGTGKPTVCPSIDISTPIRPEPGASSGMSECPALPASSSRGATPANRVRPSSLAGVSRVRTKPSPPARRSRVSPPSPARTGGNGVSSPPRSASPITSHWAQSSSHASPSPGWCPPASRRSGRGPGAAAPSSPSGIGWPSTAGACRQTRPWCSRSKDRMPATPRPAGRTR